jgi:hypothetical protein
MEINQDALLHALLKLLATLSAERTEIVRLSTELAALRNTLQQLSGDRFLPEVAVQYDALSQTAALQNADVIHEMHELSRLLHEAMPGTQGPHS